MPTSKDILNNAEKSFKKAVLAKTWVKESFAQGTADVAAFAKARAELATSVPSMKNWLDKIEDSVKDLNEGLTDLKKNESVMLAPADAKAYKAQVAEYVEAIQLAMGWSKEMSDLVKSAEKHLK
jgi:hypothetical protein